MIRWLHISDLHLGNDDMSSLRMKEKMITFLTETIGHVDYVFITGDIRSANVPNSAFTPEMADFIKSVCSRCGVEFDRLFIIPGNHDINRDIEGRHDSIIKVKYQRNGYYDSNVGKIDYDDMKAIWRGQEDFRRFIGNIYGPRRLSYYENTEVPHFTIETDDFNIIHLDSTLTYTKGQEAHELIVGTKCLYEVLQKVNINKPSILLTHYPITSLLQSEKNSVSELLRDKGVRLWLCGHEHEQNLHPYKYLHMLQAGEVQYERDGTASFLVGEYDPDTFKCRVGAYAWFREGWSKYPFIDRDGEREDTYEFELKPYNTACVTSLTTKARQANVSSLARFPKNLIRSIMPEVESNGVVVEINSLLAECWNTDSPNIILLGYGGMGKSTMLLDFIQTSQIPALYISAERMQSMGWSIEEYCKLTLFDGDSNVLQAQLSKKYTKPSLILILDGLNEVDASCERRLIQEVQRLSLMRGVQILIASRVDFSARYNLQGYRKAIVKELNDEALKSVFAPSEWEYICISPNLHRLLRNPMLVTIYKETCTVLTVEPGFANLNWILPIETSTDLFHNYYLAQIALISKQDGVSGAKLLNAIVCVFQFLPAIAYRFEIDYSLNKQNKDFRMLISDVVRVEAITENDMIQSIREQYREYSEIHLNESSITEILFNELHLIHRDGNETSFTHQMFRDYLSAQYIIHKTENAKDLESIWNSRIIPAPVCRHIQNGSGEYWKGIASVVTKKAAGNTSANNLIRNVFNCFPSSDKGGTANYSNLNLVGIQLPDLLPSHGRVSLANCCIDSVTLGLNHTQRPPFHLLRFSNDNGLLGGAYGKSISIFNLAVNEAPFFFDIGKTATQMIFYGDYFLVYAGSLIVFKKDAQWRYIGDINSESGGFFNSNFRALIGAGDFLYIYYKKKEQRYNLRVGELEQPIARSYSPTNLTEGVDLSSLRLTVDVHRANNDAEGIVASAESGKMRAISYADGRLELRNEEELAATLREGTPILMDAAISGDGLVAVTLSFATFKRGRRIQVWDTAKDIKIEELYCHPSIKHVHLSENGSWIFGTNESKSWIYNLATREEEYIDTIFSSNQYNKLITYENKVLKRDEHGRLLLYDLNKKTYTPLKTPVNNPGIVCLLKNGEIAAVGNYGRSLHFRSDRDGHLIKQSDDYSEFIAIQAFKSHPFIVAITRDRCSVYHTGTGQRTRKLEVRNHKIKFMACHPERTIFAYTDGNRRITICYYYEITHPSGPRGWWKTFSYYNNSSNRILDMAFNAQDSALIVIMANGLILRLYENNGKYKSSSQIITAFTTDAYDFNGVRCDQKIEMILHQNNCRLGN